MALIGCTRLNIDILDPYGLPGKVANFMPENPNFNVFCYISIRLYSQFIWIALSEKNVGLGPFGAFMDIYYAQFSLGFESACVSKYWPAATNMLVG